MPKICYARKNAHIASLSLLFTCFKSFRTTRGGGPLAENFAKIINFSSLIKVINQWSVMKVIDVLFQKTLAANFEQETLSHETVWQKEKVLKIIVSCQTLLIV